MKKIILLIVLLVTISALPVMAGKLPEVSASVMKYEPYPAAQGQVVKIWIKIVNVGTTAEDIEVRFKPGYPFS